ncbi:MAG: hypothetical protein Q7T11_09015 [Deltaproteobacteria bacterium]|nr:hypothetical protein [Deltaproteobacteria bacterium]
MNTTISYLIPGILIAWFIISGIVVKKKIRIPQGGFKLRRFRRVMMSR